MSPSMQRWLYPIYKVFLIKYEFGINVFNFEKRLFSIVVSLQKWLAYFYCRKTYGNYQKKTFRAKITTISYTLFINKGFKGTVFNNAVFEWRGHWKLRLQLLSRIPFDKVSFRSLYIRDIFVFQPKNWKNTGQEIVDTTSTLTVQLIF